MQIKDTLNQELAVARITLPRASGSATLTGGAGSTDVSGTGSCNAQTTINTVAMANLGRVMRVLLASSDGYLYIYNLPGRMKYTYVLVFPSLRRTEKWCRFIIGSFCWGNIPTIPPLCIFSLAWNWCARVHSGQTAPIGP